MKDKFKIIWKPLLGISLLLSAACIVWFMRDSWVCDGINNQNDRLLQASLMMRANPDCMCDNKQPALFLAFDKDNETAVDLLYQYGAELDSIYYHNHTLLTYFTKKGNTKAVQKLLHFAANPNHPSLNGDYPIFLALETQKHSILKELTDYGATEINRRNPIGDTPLLLAAKSGDWESIDILKNRANPHLPDRNGLLPLLVAKDKTTAEKLAAITDLNITDRNGDNLVHIMAGIGTMGAAWHVLGKTELFNKINRQGLTPLMIAAKKGNDQAFSHLIKQGASINALDKSGRGVAYYAKKGGNKSIQSTVKSLTAKQASRAAAMAAVEKQAAQTATKAAVTKKAASKTAQKWAIGKAGKKLVGKALSRLVPVVGTAWMAHDLYQFFTEEETPQENPNPTPKP